jgi:hypothetical protein
MGCKNFVVQSDLELNIRKISVKAAINPRAVKIRHCIVITLLKRGKTKEDTLHYLNTQIQNKSPLIF